MKYINFKDLNLSTEESRDIIEFITKKRNVNNYKGKSDAELLSAIKEKSRNSTPKKPIKNPKRKITESLTLKKSLKNIKSKKSKILTLKKSLENLKRESNQFLASKSKERIGIIREFLKDLSYKLSKSELKEIKTNLYNIEKRKQFNLKRTNKYLDELDKKILELDRYPQDYDDSEYIGVKMFVICLNYQLMKIIINQN